MVSKIEIEVDPVALTYDKKALKAVLRSAGNEIAAFTRALLRHARGTGKRGASLPGQPPAMLSGNLASSIKVKMFRNGEGVSIRDMAFYSAALETGARGGGGSTKASNMRMAGARAFGRYGKVLAKNRMIDVNKTRVLLPRPFLTTVLEQQENSIAERIRTAVTSGLKFERMRVPRK